MNAAARERRTSPITWIFGAALIGWIVVYNALRIAGRAPDEAAWVSLVVGGGLGVLIASGGLYGVRRLAASGRVVRQPPREITAALRLNDREHAAARVVAVVMVGAAALALLTGVALGTEWFASSPDDRAVTLVLLCVWNLLFAYWFADEAFRLMSGVAEGVESLALGGALTAVLASVAITRDYLPALQMVLIVVAAAAGIGGAFLAWRLHAVRTPPVAAPVVLVVAILALVLPYAG